MRELAVLDDRVQSVGVDIFKLVGQDIAPLRQLFEGRHIVIGSDDDLADLGGWAVRRGSSVITL